MPDVIITTNVDKQEIERQIRRSVRRQIGAWLRGLRQAILDLFDQPKTGKPGRYRQASAPGQPPARQSERLANDLKTSMQGDLGGVLRVDVFYGSLVDEGTARMEARPWVAPGVELFLQREADGLFALDLSQGLLDQVSEGGAL